MKRCARGSYNYCRIGKEICTCGVRILLFGFPPHSPITIHLSLLRDRTWPGRSRYLQITKEPEEDPDLEDGRSAQNKNRDSVEEMELAGTRQSWGSGQRVRKRARQYEVNE